MNGGIAFEYPGTVSPPPPSRALNQDEWPALRTTVNQVFRPDGGDLTAECPLLFDPENRDNLRVIVEGPPPVTRIVSHVGFVTRTAVALRRRLRVACVGAVFTVAGRRGEGLASRLLSDVLALTRRDADLVLLSGDRSLYRRLGFDPIPPLSLFTLPGAPSGAASPGVGTREVTGDDLNDLAALYDAENVHFERTPRDWTRLWRAGRLVNAPASLRVLTRGTRVVAYVAIQIPEPPPAGAANATRRRRILELAGDRDAITEAASTLADELLVPAYDAATILACETRGWRATAHQLSMTALTLVDAVDPPIVPWYGLNYV